MAEHDDSGRRWHLDRRVSIGHLLTTVAVAVSAVMWLTSIDTRVSLNSQSVDTVTQRVARIETRHAAALNDLKLEIRDGIVAIRTDLRALSDRVDRQNDHAVAPRP